MAVPRKHTILLRGNALEEEQGVVKTATITPGMLVERYQGGWRRHSTAGGASEYAFAREQHEYLGHEVDSTIAVGDTLTVLHPNVGSVIYAYTTDTLGIGDPVESDGVGGVRLRDDGALIGFCRLASDITNSHVELQIGGAVPDLTS